MKPPPASSSTETLHPEGGRGDERVVEGVMKCQGIFPLVKPVCTGSDMKRTGDLNDEKPTLVSVDLSPLKFL